MPSISRKKGTPEKRPRNAADTRLRILEAAKVRFSRASYEQVGMREIAADAGADAALVVRYFGSKEKLFGEVASGAFDVGDLLQTPPAEWGTTIAQHLMTPIDGSSWPEGFDPFQLLLRSAVSPVASAIVARELHAGFVKPFAAALRGKNTEMRAGLIASCTLGFAMMRVALQSPAIASADPHKLTETLAAMLQRQIDGGK